MFHWVQWVPILPLIGAAFNGAYAFTGARLVRRTVHTVACGALFLSFLITLATFLHFRGLPAEERQLTVTLWRWIEIGSLKADVSFLIDPLSLVMMLVVTGVGFVIHVYSVGYMAHDPGYARYFAYLNLFCFAMLTLVMGANLFVMFIGWEGVGLCSYLLIGFWFGDEMKAAAGRKAFIVNRVGDFGFLVGLLLLFWSLQAAGHPTVTFTELRGSVSLLPLPVVTAVCLFFFVGATGKSAQIPLYVWLPDAMAGPTPVSALIHAATMVTAGVYMIGRLNFLYSMSPVALNVVAVTGFATALFAASIGFAQNDIKKVLAYSTVSQLGFMFGAMGVGAYTAGIFHLVTHAFFKACLFLGSGSVIHAMSGEQDMRKMGGLKTLTPVTFGTFFIATLAIAGIFPFAGFFSKDEILWQAMNQNPIFWVAGIVAAAGTAIYMFRLVAMTFFGACRAEGEVKHHIHESPRSMTVPLMILAFLSIVGGFLGFPHHNLFEGWLEETLPAAPLSRLALGGIAEYGLMAVSLAVAAVAACGGFLLYTKRRDIPEKIVAAWPRLYRVVLNKYYVDEFYQFVFVRGILAFNRLLALFDQKVIDGIVNLAGKSTKVFSFLSGWFDRLFVDGAVNAVADLTSRGGAAARRLQSGKIQVYLYYAVGAVVILMIYKFM